MLLAFFLLQLKTRDTQREINLLIFHLNYILIHVNILPYSVLNWEYLKMSALGITLATVEKYNSITLLNFREWRRIYCILALKPLSSNLLQHVTCFTFLRCIYITIFWQFFFNYRKTCFHVNGVNNYFIILCTFPNISFWRRSIFFPSFFCNQNRLGFKKNLESKLSDQSIVCKKGWRETKERRRLNFRKASNSLSS